MKVRSRFKEYLLLSSRLRTLAEQTQKSRETFYLYKIQINQKLYDNDFDKKYKFVRSCLYLQFSIDCIMGSQTKDHICLGGSLLASGSNGHKPGKFAKNSVIGHHIDHEYYSRRVVERLIRTVNSSVWTKRNALISYRRIEISSRHTKSQTGRGQIRIANIIQQANSNLVAKRA